jgi:hypothetical protein
MQENCNSEYKMIPKSKIMLVDLLDQQIKHYMDSMAKGSDKGKSNASMAKGTDFLKLMVQ